MEIITVSGTVLDVLLSRIEARDGHPHTVRVALDGDGVKVKVNGGEWSPSYPVDAEDVARRARGGSETNRWYGHKGVCRMRAAFYAAQNVQQAAEEGHDAYQGAAQWDAEQYARLADEYLANGEVQCVCAVAAHMVQVG